MIKFHSQVFYESASELIARESKHLLQLIGLRLECAWMAQEPDGSWFKDEPIILRFDNDNQIEVGVCKVGLMAITWGTVSTQLSANWLGCWDSSYHLRWQQIKTGPVQQVLGERLQAVEIADYKSLLGDGVHAIKLDFESAALVIYNALDELGISSQFREDSQMTLFKVG